MSRGKTARRVARQQRHGRDSHVISAERRAKLREQAARKVRAALAQLHNKSTREACEDLGLRDCQRCERPTCAECAGDEDIDGNGNGVRTCRACCAARREAHA